MKNVLSRISMLLGVMAIFLVVACNGDSDAPITCSDGLLNGDEVGVDCGGSCPPCAVTTTVAEDKANIQKTLDDVLQCVTDLKKARSTQVLLRDFLGMSDGEVVNEDWLEDMTNDLAEVLDTDVIEDNNRLDLAYHAGTHRYVHATKTWEKLASPSDKIIFEFPTQESNSTNNAVLTMDRYADEEVTIQGETMFLPTDINVGLVVDGNSIMEVELKDVTYADNADFEIPVELDLRLFFDPITITMDVDRKTNTEFSAVMSMTDTQLCNYRVELDAELRDDDFENISEGSFKKIEAKVSIGALSIQSLAGLAELIALDDPTQTQINSLLDLDVLFNGVKIADLEYDEEANTINIFYKDSTSEDGNNYIDQFLDDLELLLEEFTGGW